MLVPMGKITEDNIIAGLVAFDTDKNGIRRLTWKEAQNIANETSKIAGFKNIIHFKTETMVMRDKTYPWDEIPECNGMCIPENGENTLVLIGKYKDTKLKLQNNFYLISDSYGNTELKSSAKLKELLATQKVIGIRIGKENNLILRNFTKLSSADLVHLGYTRVNKVWRKIEIQQPEDEQNTSISDEIQEHVK